MRYQLLVDACGWTLLHFLWQAAAIATLLAMVLWMLPVSRSAIRYTTSCAALLLMIMAIGGTFAWQIGAAPASSASSAQPLRSEIPSPTPAPTRAAADTAGKFVAIKTPAVVDSVAATLEPDSPWYAQLESRLAPWMGLLVALWAAGVMLLSLRLAINWVAVRRLRSSGTPMDSDLWANTLARFQQQLTISYPVRVAQSTAAVVPMVIGWLRPVILVPVELITGLTPGQIEAIVAHELAHIRRHDYLVNLLQNLVETLLFYHPAVWWVSRQIRREREFCCDDIAARLCNGTATYARALATVETLRGTTPTLGMAASGGSLVTRIRRLAGRQPRQRVGASGVLAVAVVMGCAIVATAGLVGSASDKSTQREVSVAHSENEVVRIKGRVIDVNSKPVAGAHVTCSLSTPGDLTTIDATSDAKGYFTLEIPPSAKPRGNELVWVYAAGHAVGQETLDRLQETRLDGSLCDVKLPADDRLTYRVLDPSGKPCAGLPVTPRLVTGSFELFGAHRVPWSSGLLPAVMAEQLTQHTDAQGYVTLQGIKRSYACSVAVAHPEFGQQEFRQAEGDLQLREVGSIRGRVEMDDVASLAGTHVYIATHGPRRQRYGGFATVALNQQGEFTVPAIPPGKLQISFDWPDDHPRLPEFERPYPEVRIGKTLELQFATRATVEITGRVVLGETGQALRGAEVSVLSSHVPCESAQVITDQHGFFTARHIAGPVGVSVNSIGDDPELQEKYQDYSIWDSEVFVVQHGVAERNFGDIFVWPRKRSSGEHHFPGQPYFPYEYITYGSATEAETSPPQGNATAPLGDDSKAGTASISGRVVATSGEPIPGAHVIYPLMVDGQEKVRSTQTSDQGTFSLKVPRNAAYDMPEHIWAYAAGHVVGATSLGTAIDDSNEIRNLEIELPRADPVHYQVQLPSGEPCVGAAFAPHEVNVLDKTRDNESDADVPRTIPGELAQLAGRTTDELGKVTLDSTTASRLHSVTVTRDEFGKQLFERPGGEIQLAPAGSIEGVVAGASHGELTGTVVRLLTTSDVHDHQGIATAKIDERGRFAVPAIAIGRLNLQLLMPCHDAERLPYLEHTMLEVRANETLAVEMELRATVLVRGTLRDPKAGALANANLTFLSRHCPVPHLQCATNAKGNFQVRLLPGDYTLPLLAPDKVDNYSSTFGLPLTLSVPADTEGMEFDIEISQ